ncbi:MAG TPA: nuclear transport factor 2 family protein [Puia sp.]
MKAICDAFTKGNIAFILESFPEKFTWHDPCDPFIVPYGGIFKGKTGMSEFFHLPSTNTDMHLFEVHEYIGEDDKVVATGKYEFGSTRTGEHATSEWIVRYSISKMKNRFQSGCIIILPTLKKHFPKKFSAHSIDNY